MAPRTHLARARIAEKAPQKISTQTRLGPHQSAVGAVSTNLRRYQGSRRYSAVLAAGPETATAAGRIHRARSAQRFAVLGLRRRTLRFRQRCLRLAHPAAPGSLGRLAARSGLANRQRQRIQRRFPTALGDSQHLRIPPAAHTYQSDVETVHRLVEDEFFDLEDFSSRGEFLAKVQTYQLYFNSSGPTPTNKIRVPGKSSSASLLARLSNSACFHPSFWIITSMPQGDTMCLGFPIVHVRLHSQLWRSF